jgi:hypothetical protein
MSLKIFADMIVDTFVSSRVSDIVMSNHVYDASRDENKNRLKRADTALALMNAKYRIAR